MKNVKDCLKFKNGGITLIALVITIIVLLILAGVSIAMLTGDNGILTQATTSKKKSDEAQDIEKIRLAISEAQMGEDGYQELTTENLGTALIEDGVKSIVSDNEDGTRHILLLDEKREYKLDSSGNIENLNVDFDAKYVAPTSQGDERNNGVIGIGTDGKPVDMDLWLYSFDTVTSGYGLNSKEVFQNTEYNSNGKNTETIRNPGYQGTETNGKDIIIPQYISVDGGKSYSPVTSLYRTFNNNTNITTMPVIPTTVTNMFATFENCTNLKECILPNLVENINWCFTSTSIEKIGKIPNTVVYMEGTFCRCNLLIEVDLTIPRNVVTLQMAFYDCENLQKANLISGENVENMSLTFASCENLLEISNIPANIQNMHQTFFKCTNLTNLNNLVIPASVNDLRETFSECTNLSGTLIINTKNIADASEYAGIFNLAVRTDKALKIKGESNIIDDIIRNSNNPNIIKD